MPLDVLISFEKGRQAQETLSDLRLLDSAFQTKMSKTNNYRRYNPLLDEWVIVAANRVNRPWQGAQTESPDSGFQKTEGLNQLAPGGTRANGLVTPNYLSTYVFENDFPCFTNFEETEGETGIERKRMRVSEPAADDPLFRQETIRGTCRVSCLADSLSLSLSSLPCDCRSHYLFHLLSSSTPAIVAITVFVSLSEHDSKVTSTVPQCVGFLVHITATITVFPSISVS